MPITRELPQITVDLAAISGTMKALRFRALASAMKRAYSGVRT